MEYTTLGNTDIQISKLCVGCMSFGKAGTMHDWTLDETETEKVVKHALSLKINFFDTANGYSAGTSEEYLGRALKKNIARDKVVIASKVYFNPGRLSAGAIHREIDGTLKRLGTDYLDLYIIHHFDYDTPIEETMEALNDLVKAGKVRALGASAMYGYQFYNMQLAARDHGWAQFQAMENHYNLLYREDERELIPICKQMGVSLMPYSPLAAGHLTRPQWNADTLRSRTDRVAMGKYDRTEEQDMQIVLRVQELAERYGVKMQQIALAWHWAKGVAAPIVGATKARYLDDALGALTVKLTAEDIAYLEEPYLPHRVVVHGHRRLRARQAAQKRLHVLIARAAAAVFHIVFKRRIISRRLCRGVRRALAQAGAAKVRVQRHAGRVDDRAQRRQLLFLCTCQNARAEYACLRQRGKAAAHFVSQRVQLLAHALAQQHRRQRRHLELVPTEQLVHPRDGTKQIFFHAFPSPRPTRSASGASSPVCLYPIRKAFARQEKPEPFAESAMQFWFFYCSQERGSSRGRKFSILENFCLFGTASCRGVPASSPVGIKYGKLEVVDLKKWFSSNLSSRIVLLD